MAVGTFVRVAGGSFTKDSDSSDAASAAATGALELGAVASLNLFYAVDGTVLDGIDASRSWSLVGSEANAPATSAINQSPAQQYVHGQTRRWRSSFTRPAGSCSIVLTYAVSSQEVAAFPALLFGCGADGNTNAVLNARHQDGGLRFFADNQDAHGRIDTGLGAGGRSICFSFDAITNTGAVLLASGDPMTAPFSAPPSAQPWSVGGWSDGFGFAGKLGNSVLIFDRALHTDVNRPAAQRLLAALNAAHGLAS